MTLSVDLSRERPLTSLRCPARRVAVRNSGALRTAIGVHHYAPVRLSFVGRSLPAHEGKGRRRHQQHRAHERGFLLRLDTLRARLEWTLRFRSIDPRTVEPAPRPVAVTERTMRSTKNTFAVCRAVDRDDCLADTRSLYKREQSKVCDERER